MWHGETQKKMLLGFEFQKFIPIKEIMLDVSNNKKENEV